MKIIQTNGITYLEPVPGGTAEWYYGMDYNQGDLYEAEEMVREGLPVEGNRLVLVSYPGGEVFEPVAKEAGTYSGTPLYYQDGIYTISVDFVRQTIRIYRFDCRTHECRMEQELPLSIVKDCYNLQLHASPLCLTRQGGENLFEIVWPEKASFAMDPHESFFLRDGEKLYFSKWYEEGEGETYRYWEETVVRNLAGELTEVLPGDLQMMPNGEIWSVR
ncbi:MAG: hypothetical protein IKQ96_05790 [Lachnospiraceae bacterium]|nr:hypothetical protein [Lachnospiraceae bacterium]